MKESLQEQQESLPYAFSLLSPEHHTPKDADILLLHSSYLPDWDHSFGSSPCLVALETEEDKQTVQSWSQKWNVDVLTIPQDEVCQKLKVISLRTRKKHKHIFFWCGGVILLAAALFSIPWFTKEELSTNQSITSESASPSSSESITQPESPVSISVFGNEEIWNSLQKEKNVTGKLWKQEEIKTAIIPKDTRFILLPVSNYTKDEIMLFRSWIEKKHVVMLYGTPLKQQDIASFFGPAVEVYDLQSTGKIEYALYGYGYSEEQKKNMPFFLMLSAEDTEPVKQIVSFLSSYRDK